MKIFEPAFRREWPTHAQKTVKRRAPLALRLGACVLSMLMAPLSASAQTPPLQGKPVRVGLVTPLTGGNADVGNSTRLGAELAIKEINESGGLLGRPLELVVRDDKGSPDEGRKVSEDLVLKEKVDARKATCSWAFLADASQAGTPPGFTETVSGCDPPARPAKRVRDSASILPARGLPIACPAAAG